MPEKFFHQPSAMSSQARFAHAPKADIERSKFDRSHGHKTTFDAGPLVPIFVDEVLPGDTYHMSETLFARLSTPLKPVMDNMWMETFYFFVPYRLVWDNWQRFCGERSNPNDDPTALTIPQGTYNLANLEPNYLLNYFGLPLGRTGDFSFSALPIRAYFLIFNEWFRDQNLQAPAVMSTGDGPDDFDLVGVPINRGKRHDYFTSCLPWPQKGDPVLIPVDDLPIMGSTTAGAATVYPQGDPAKQGNLQINTTGAIVKSGTPPAAATTMIWNDPRLRTELETATGATINDLRAAFQIQRLLERDARGGSRYIELILSHFGVHSDDARLQRPEYLGGGKCRIGISPVPATFHNTEVAQGDLAGFGTALNRGRWSKSFTEHGVLIGLANVRADLTYQGGVERFWNRKTRYDFYWPALAHLGEQAVLNREIHLNNDTLGTDDGVFGYQERYSEYRYKPSRVSGQFSSGLTDSLDVWHLAQDFFETPLLNSAFISEAPPIARIVAVPTEPQFLADIYFDLKCDRPMPVYGVPGYADHF